MTARIPGFEFLILCGDWNGHVGRGDWNGHVGRAGTRYREMHGGMGHCRQNQMLRVIEP